jgi:phage I-like protein
MPTMPAPNFALPADGLFQLVPLGEHRLRLNRKTDSALVNALESRGVVFPAGGGDRVSVIQVVDADAVAAMVNAFRAEAAAPNFPGLLVDEDHLSLSPEHPTAARGWIVNIVARPDGLYGAIKLVDETDLTSGRYRLLSPVFEPADLACVGGNRVRPMRLANAALTNRPNMRTMRPLSNRETHNEEEEPMNYGPEIRQALDLKADVAEDAIVPAIVALTNRVRESDAVIGQRDAAMAAHVQTEAQRVALANRVTELETELSTLRNAERDRLIEADLVEFAAVVANREAVRKALIANRDLVRDMLAGLLAKAQTPTEPLRNRETAGTPSPSEPAAALANRMAEQTEFVNRIMVECRCASRAAAIEIAQQRKPDLFG